MPQVLLQVDEISNDELATGLVEMDKQPDGRDESIRFQVITVVRNDRQANWVYELGPSKNFHAHGFSIPAGQVWPDGVIEAWHTVGELRDMADKLRTSRKDDMVPNEPSRNWLAGFKEEIDLRNRVANKVSIFGRFFQKMRY